MIKIFKEHKTWQAVYDFSKKLKNVDDGTQYAIDVFNFKIKVCNYAYYQCARHMLFLYKEKTDGSFPFVYSRKRGDAFLHFISQIIVPEINAPFIIPPFRKFISYFVLGWRYKNNKTRILTKEIFETAARKQWKSSYYAAFMLAVCLEILGDGNPQIFISGPQSKTSKIPYNIAKNYILKSPKIAPAFSHYNTRRIESKRYGVINHIPFVKSAIEGNNPSLTIFTEYHLHPDDTMVESAISSRNTSRPNALIVYDTTKGHDVNGVCFKREHNYKRYLLEQMELPDEISTKAHIFLFANELNFEEYDNWRESDLWYQANPALNISVSMEDLLDEFNTITDNASETEFKIKRLGMWVGGATSYFELGQLLKSQEKNKEVIEKFISSGEIYKAPATMGLDLSATTDTTAVVLNFEIPTDDGKTIQYFIPHVFIPSQGLVKKEKEDRADYIDWQKQGYCTIIDGPAIDQKYIADYIIKMKKKYNIIYIGYDNYFTFALFPLLNQLGAIEPEELVKIKQGSELTGTFREFERTLLWNQVGFDAEKLYINHALNVKVKEYGNENKVWIDKISPSHRIDAFMAGLFAFSVRKQKQIETIAPEFWTMSIGEKH